MDVMGRLKWVHDRLDKKEEDLKREKGVDDALLQTKRVNAIRTQFQKVAGIKQQFNKIKRYRIDRICEIIEHRHPAQLNDKEQHNHQNPFGRDSSLATTNPAIFHKTAISVLTGSEAIFECVLSGESLEFVEEEELPLPAHNRR